MDTLYLMDTTADPITELRSLLLDEIEKSWLGEFVEGLNLWLWEKGWVNYG